jgi:CheY-like chemotaxis protein
MSISEPEPRPVVLVVEDETLVRLFASDFLDEAGFKVFEAVNADEALAVLQARPDVQAIVTDIEMPGAMNGIALAKAVRERWPGVRIVIISGRLNWPVYMLAWAPKSASVTSLTYSHGVRCKFLALRRGALHAAYHYHNNPHCRRTVDLSCLGCCTRRGDRS